MLSQRITPPKVFGSGINQKDFNIQNNHNDSEQHTMKRKDYRKRKINKIIWEEETRKRGYK